MSKFNILILTILGLFSFLILLDFISIRFLFDYFQTQNVVHIIEDNEGYVKYRKIFSRKPINPKGTIFIYPPTGGENIVDRLYARTLAAKNFEVFILQEWTNYDIKGVKYELHNIFYDSAQKALKKVSKLAHAKNWGVLGTSVGALHASVALTLNSDLKTGFMIVGGLPIPEIILNSSQPAMRELKSLRYKEYKLKDDRQYLKELSHVFQLEPMNQTQNYSKHKKIGAILSTNDNLVPYVNQKKAQVFFNTNPTKISPLSHVQTVAWFGLFRRSLVLNFFTENL